MGVVVKTSAHSGWLATGFNHCKAPLSAGEKPKPAGVVNERLREAEPDGGPDPNKLVYRAELLKRSPIDWFWLATALAIGRYVKQHAWSETILATGICISAINTRRIAKA
jgi:hypothetical protein